VALILEVLDPRTGEVRTRRRLEGQRLSLGRGYDNDVMLDDPYVDARHAHIGLDETGSPVIEDLGSVNALIGPDGTRQTRMVLRPGTVVRVGRTALRFQDPDAPLPPALPDVPPPAQRRRLPHWLGTWWGQLGVTAVAAGVFAWNAWLGTYGKSGASDAVSTALALLLLLALWAGVWAVASRVVVHRFRFLAHLAVASGIALAGLACGTASAWGAFLFPDNRLGEVASGCIVLLLVAILIAAHLALASSLTRRRRWLAGLGTSGIILLIGMVVMLAQEKSFSDVPTFSATLKPLPAALLPAGDMRDFTTVEADLQRRVDALAAESE
jgi:hypothetical protein